MRSATLAYGFCLLAAVAIAQGKKDDKKIVPIASRGWNCHAAGGLIDGSCIGVKDNCAVIANGGAHVQVPLELFSADDQKAICEHFGVEPPKAEQPDFGGNPWHSARGGVMVFGKIVGRDGEVLQIEDSKGRKFRVPYFMLASGTKDHAKAALKELEGKDFKPAEEQPKPEPRPSRPTPPKTTPRPETKPAPTPETKSTTTPEPKSPMPAPVEEKEPHPRGQSRQWRFRNGIVVDEGAFVSLKDDIVRIQKKDGTPSQVPLQLLMDSDRQYAEALARGEMPGKAPQGAIEVESETPRFWASRDGKTLLLIDGKTMRLLSPDGAKSLAKHPLGGEVSAIGERAEYFVLGIGKELVLIDKPALVGANSKLVIKAKHELWRYQRIHDLTLHPTRRVAYVSVEGAIDDVRNNPDEKQRVILVDEKTGDPSEPGDVFASWVIADPAGKYVYAGFRDVFRSGSDVRINGDGRLLETPEYTNVDILSRFRVEGDKLVMDDMFKNAGANGQGMTLSPDGKRIIYLSFTGYPTFSGNVTALDATDFKKKPVTFATKDVSDCRRMQFHPRLPLTVSPADKGPVLYDATTGKASPEHLSNAKNLGSFATHAFTFTPDGQRLALVISKAGGQRYLETLPLKLSAAELALCKARAPSAAAAPAETARPVPSASRTWTDTTGSFRVQATYRGRENNRIVLEKTDGSLVRVPIDKLSPADQNWLEENVK
jgi:hypothetical protein